MTMTMKKITDKYELHHLDTCLPDYFGGYPKPVLQIIATNDMTGRDFVDAVVDEYNQVYDHLTMEGYEYDDKNKKAWPHLSSDEIRELAADCLTIPLNDLVFAHLEDDDDDDDDGDNVYCYLAIHKK